MAANRHYDWTTIQQYYDQGFSIRQVTKRFGCSNLTIQRARDQLLFKPRDKNERRSVILDKSYKICYCGEEIRTRRSKFCSTKCYSNNKRNLYIERWELGLENGSNKSLELKRFIKQYLIKQIGSCEICGFYAFNPYSGNSILEVDHLSGDASDNRRNNLRVLCKNCHAMTSTYGMLNKGNGRASKRVFYARLKEKLTH